MYYLGVARTIETRNRCLLCCFVFALSKLGVFFSYTGVCKRVMGKDGWWKCTASALLGQSEPETGLWATGARIPSPAPPPLSVLFLFFFQGRTPSWLKFLPTHHRRFLFGFCFFFRVQNSPQAGPVQEGTPFDSFWSVFVHFFPSFSKLFREQNRFPEI